MRSIQRYYERRQNAIGRRLFEWHHRYSLPALVPVLWVAWLGLGIIQILWVLFG